MHTTPSASARSHRPRSYTVFGAAFVAGAAAAFGVNSVLDAHLARSRPQVESESILVAIRSLPAGAPVTVWDVALRDWPKAMVPAAAMRVTDDLDNLVARHPLREGQPVLAVQLARVDGDQTAAKPIETVSTLQQGHAAPERDLWDPGQPATPPRETIAARPPTRVEPARETVTRTEAPTTGPAVPAPQAAPVAAPAVAALTTPAPATTPPATPAAPSVTPPATPAPSVDPLTLPGGGPETDTVATATPATEITETPATVAAPVEAAPATVAAAPESPAPESPAADRAADVAATSSDATRPRAGTRPHPSAVQFLSVPAPESLEADAQPPLPDDTSTAWVGEQAPSATPDAAKPAAATANRGTPKNGAAARSARAPAQPQRQSQAQQQARKPQRSQRTADTRGYRPH